MNSDLDPQTLSNMEIALERSCANIPGAEKRRARRHIAHRIIRCARKGGRTLELLLRAGEIAAAELRKRATAGIEARPPVRDSSKPTGVDLLLPVLNQSNLPHIETLCSAPARAVSIP